MFGGAIFPLAFAFSLTGLALGFAVVVTVALLNDYTCCLLLRAARRCDDLGARDANGSTLSFEELARFCGGAPRSRSRASPSSYSSSAPAAAVSPSSARLVDARSAARDSSPAATTPTPPALPPPRGRARSVLVSASRRRRARRRRRRRRRRAHPPRPRPALPRPRHHQPRPRGRRRTRAPPRARRRRRLASGARGSRKPPTTRRVRVEGQGSLRGGARVSHPRIRVLRPPGVTADAQGDDREGTRRGSKATPRKKKTRATSEDDRTTTTTRLSTFPTKPKPRLSRGAASVARRARRRRCPRMFFSTPQTRFVPSARGTTRTSRDRRRRRDVSRAFARRASHRLGGCRRGRRGDDDGGRRLGGRRRVFRVRRRERCPSNVVGGASRGGVPRTIHTCVSRSPRSRTSPSARADTRCTATTRAMTSCSTRVRRRWTPR